MILDERVVIISTMRVYRAALLRGIEPRKIKAYTPQVMFGSLDSSRVDVDGARAWAH